MRTQITERPCEKATSDPLDLAWVPRFCVANKLPGEADGPVTTLQGARFHTVMGPEAVLPPLTPHLGPPGKEAGGMTGCWFSTRKDVFVHRLLFGAVAFHASLSLFER